MPRLSDIGSGTRLAVAVAIGVLVSVGRWTIAHAVTIDPGDLLGHSVLVAAAVSLVLTAAARRGAVDLVLPAIALALVGDLISYRVYGPVHGGMVSSLGAAFPLTALAALLFLTPQVDAWRLHAVWKVIAITGLALMALPLLPGVGITKGGQTGWAHLPLIGQGMPGEIGRPLVILAFALVVGGASRLPAQRLTFRELVTVWRPAGWTLACAILFQLITRDFGPVVLLVAAGAITVALATNRLRLLVSAFAAIALGVLLAGAVLPYVGERVAAVTDPFGVPRDESTVGQLAFARMVLSWGGTFGTGLGRGLVTGPAGIPAGDTDFALTTFAMEAGLAGMVLVLAILAGFLAALWRRTAAAPTGIARIASGALVGLLAFQACWVAGAVCGWLPLSGLTLPLVSSGGSSALAIALIVAMVAALTANVHEGGAIPSTRGTHAAQRLAVGSVVILGALACATGVRAYGDQLDNNRDPRNPIWQHKYYDRGVVLASDGEVQQFATGQSSLNTVKWHSRASPAMEAILGDPATDLMGDGGVGLSGAMRAAARCGGSEQARYVGAVWEHGAPIVAGNPAKCRPAGVQTTLNADLTDAADRALGDRPGSVTIVDASTGDVLALAGRSATSSRPTPEIALRAALPPGSTLKVLTAAVAVSIGVTRMPYAAQHTASDGVTVTGEWCGGTLTQMLAVSCNQGFAGIAEHAGAAKLVEQATRLGFDRDADINGLAVARSTIFAGARPTPGLTATAGIGQGRALSTGIGMAEVVSALAAGGVVHRPRLVSAICDAAGTAVQQTAPRRSISAMRAGVARTVVRAMEGPLSAAGTARHLAWLPWIAAVKTGTAEIGARQDLRTPAGNIAWLVAVTRPGKRHGPLVIVVNLLPTSGAAHLIGGRDAGAVVARLDASVARSLAGPPLKLCERDTRIR